MSAMFIFNILNLYVIVTTLLDTYLLHIFNKVMQEPIRLAMWLWREISIIRIYGERQVNQKYKIKAERKKTTYW